MLFAISMAHRLSKKLSEVRKTKGLEYLRPDGKTQVTVEYEKDIPKRIETILISNQYEKDTNVEKMRNNIIDKVVKKLYHMNTLIGIQKYILIQQKDLL